MGAANGARLLVWGRGVGEEVLAVGFVRHGCDPKELLRQFQLGKVEGYRTYGFGVFQF